MEIPVLNRNQGPIAEADAKRSEAAARVLALQARIVGEVDHAVAVWLGAQTRLNALEELRAAQKTRLSSLQTQFEAGAAEALDLRLAEVELATDELLHWNARLKTLRALGEVEDAIQFPLPPGQKPDVRGQRTEGRGHSPLMSDLCPLTSDLSSNPRHSEP